MGQRERFLACAVEEALASDTDESETRGAPSIEPKRLHSCASHVSVTAFEHSDWSAQAAAVSRDDSTYVSK